MAYLPGTDADETINGTSEDDSGRGYGGADILNGADGADTLYGDEGDDTLNGGNGDDSLMGGEGDDIVNGGDGADRLRGNGGSDIVDGGDGADTVTIEYDGDGVDSYKGGAGADLFYIDVVYPYDLPSNLAGLDHVVDFSASDGDRISLGSGYGGKYPYYNAYYIWYGAITDPTFSLSAGKTLPGGLGPNLVGMWTWADAGKTYLIIDINRTQTLDNNDLVLAFDNGASLSQASFVDDTFVAQAGTAGADTFSGTSSDDVVYSAGGGDTVSGLAGSDQLNGGDGDDTLDGGDGGDVLAGELGNDVLHGGAGNDMLYAGSRYGSFEDTAGSVNTLYGDDGDDYLMGGSGLDTLYGGTGNDLLVGGVGDTLHGGDGADQLQINATYDEVAVGTLDGGAGDDQIYMNAPQVATGGAGADRFNVGFVRNSAHPPGYATITDFNATEGDRLDFSGTEELWRPTFRGALDNPAFSLTNGAVFSRDDYGPEFAQIWTWTQGGDTYLIVDVNQDGVLQYGTPESDFVVKFNGPIGLDANAFVANYLMAGTYGTSAGDILNGGADVDGYYGVNGDDQLHGGGGGDFLFGNNGADKLWGDDGADQLDGGAGDDLLEGGEGDDKLSGGAGSDVLHGGAGKDQLNGGGSGVTAADEATTINRLYGEGGDDRVSSVGPHDELYGGDGADLVIGSGLLYGEAGDDILYSITASILDGGAGDDKLTGGDADDTLIGGAGNDELKGGLGNDAYWVDNAGDTITERADAGFDTVATYVDYVLSAHVEQLILVGGALVGTGSSTDNVLVGNALANTLYGMGGDDTLSGEGGADTMVGGQGGDAYWVDNTGDIVTELAGEGFDTIASFVSYTLSANVEQLILVGTAANATGNNDANMLIGNAANNILTGLDGNDVMVGNGGLDTMIGGRGDDAYWVGSTTDVITELAGEGYDSVAAFVSYTLSANLEQLVLLGTAANGIGNASANTLTGNALNNVLDGQGGADRLVGGLGDDAYWVDNVGDVVVELAGEGFDTIASFVSYTLSANIEQLKLVGTVALTATGSASANILNGNGLDNTLYGLGGDDVLAGEAGADTMIGGIGNDAYWVDNIGDVIVENAGEGFESVASSVSYTLSANLEQLVLLGAAVSATGNAQANVLVGNGLDNTITGGGGNDILTGGAGVDTFVFGPGSGQDRVTDFGLGGAHDVLNLSAYTGTGVTWTVTQQGGNTLVAMTNGDSILLDGVLASHVTTQGTSLIWN